MSTRPPLSELIVFALVWGVCFPALADMQLGEGFVLFGPLPAAAQETPLDPGAMPARKLEEIQGPVRIRDVGGQVVAEPVEISPVLPADALPYFISKLDFNGVVIDNRAELSAEIHVSITGEKVWQEVPLRLPEAHVVAADYEGSGQQTMSKASERAEGLTWKFRGKGEHRLFLELEVPLKRAANGLRLDLTLPKLESVFRGNLTLRIPGAPLEITPIGADLKPIEVVNGQTRIQATVPGVTNPGTGSQVSFVWSRRDQAQAGELAFAQTDVALRLDTEKQEVRLDVKQKLRSADRVLSSMKMWIPDGFEDKGAIGTRLVEYRPGVGEDGRAFISVQFDDLQEPEAELDWVFTRPFDDDLTELTFSGFEIDSVDRHRTFLTVKRDENYRLSVDWTAVTGGVQRAPLTSDGVVAVDSTSYPLSVPIQIRKERPSISVAPVTSVTLRNAEVELRTDFQVAVDRGAVDELTLNWDQVERGDWSDVRVEAPGGELIESDGRVRIRLDRPRRGDFVVSLRAVKGVRQPGDVRLFLPTILAESAMPTRLGVFAVDSVDADVRADGESRLHRLVDTDDTVPPTSVVDSAAAERTRLLDWFVVSGEPATVTVTPSVRQMERSATTLIQLQAVQPLGDVDLGVSVLQTIQLGVQYGRVNDVLLAVPASLRGTLPESIAIDDRLFRVDGKPIDPTSIEPAGDGLYRLLFDTPRTDAAISIGPYLQSVPMTAGSNGAGAEVGQLQTIPVVSLAGAGWAYESVRCEVRRNGLFRIEPKDIVTAKAAASVGQWVESAMTPADAVTWVTASPPQSVDGIEVAVQTSPELTQSVFGVRNAETEVIRDSTGFRIRCEYQVVQAVDALTIGMPVAAESVRFTWNQSPLLNTVRLEPTNGDQWTTFQIPVPDRGAGALVLEYSIAGEPPGMIARDVVPLPVLPSGAWVERSLVEYVVAGNRHLARVSGALSAEFDWMRRGLIWSRDSAKTLSFTSVSDDLALNRYLFSSTTAPRTVTFTTAQGSLLILGGAFTTFAVAFLFYVVPGLRQVPIVLLPGLLLAVFGLADPALVQVLLQPAGVGLVFAAIAIGIDRARNGRRAPAPVLTIVSESEYSVPSAIVESRSESGYSQTIVRNAR